MGNKQLIGSTMESVKACIELIALTSKDTAEFEIRENSLSLLDMLSREVKNSLDSRGHYSTRFQEVIQRILLPNLVWKGGRKAMVLRNLALKSMHSHVQHYHNVDSWQPEIVVAVVKSVNGLLDEDVLESRQVSLQILKLTFDSLHSVYDGKLSSPLIFITTSRYMKRF